MPHPNHDGERGEAPDLRLAIPPRYRSAIFELGPSKVDRHASERRVVPPTAPKDRRRPSALGNGKPS